MFSWFIFLIWYNCTYNWSIRGFDDAFDYNIDWFNHYSNNWYWRKAFFVFALAKTLVHEWAHLRYGLFNEYATEGYKHFYHTQHREVEPVRCSRRVQGKSVVHLRNGKERPCRIDRKTSLPEAECRFFADNNNTRATGSLLFFHFLNSVSKISWKFMIGSYRVWICHKVQQCLHCWVWHYSSTPLFCSIFKNVFEWK